MARPFTSPPWRVHSGQMTTSTSALKGHYCEYMMTVEVAGLPRAARDAAWDIAVWSRQVLDQLAGHRVGDAIETAEALANRAEAWIIASGLAELFADSLDGLALADLPASSVALDGWRSRDRQPACVIPLRTDN